MKPEPQLSKKEYDRQRYIANREKILEQTREYKKNNRALLREKSKEYYQQNRERILAKPKTEAQRTWHYKTENGLTYQREFARRPEQITKNRVRSSTRYYNQKSGICNDCNTEADTEFHHISYEPNIFMEVCKECHNKHHHH